MGRTQTRGDFLVIPVNLVPSKLGGFIGGQDQPELTSQPPTLAEESLRLVRVLQSYSISGPPPFRDLSSMGFADGGVKNYF